MPETLPALPAELEAVVDLAFTVAGQRVPLDHGYALYGAICRVVPQAHEASWLGIHPLRGLHLGGDLLRLAPRSSLRLRVPAARIPTLLPLSGHRLVLAGGDPLQIGTPTVEPLRPCPSLDARLVAVRLTDPPRRADGTLDKAAFETRFREELRRRLATYGITAEPTLHGRQHLRVGGQRVLGWSVRIAGLSPQASLHLQALGLGGKRAMGCGVFVPTRGA